MKKIEDHNTLVFIVDEKANKHHIKKAVFALYNVKAVRVSRLSINIVPIFYFRSTPSLPHSSRKRLSCDLPRTMMLWMLPTRLDSSKSYCCSLYAIVTIKCYYLKRSSNLEHNFKTGGN